MSKKGDYDIGHQVIYYILASILIAIVFIYCFSFFNQKKAETVLNMDDVEDFVLVNKILSSCLAYKDEAVERVIPGEIDIKKFNDKDLRNCIKYTDKMVRLTLGGTNIVSSESVRVKESEKEYKRFVIVRDKKSTGEILKIEVFKEDE